MLITSNLTPNQTKRYLKPNESAATLITAVLTAHACPLPLAQTVQRICAGVSYTTETTNPPSHTAALVAQHPELAVVQDADRLDAIGAVGLGRMFTYGGAKTARSMAASMAHLDEKLVKLEGMMKTEVGRGVAKVRGERLRVFRGWWVEEVGAEGLESA